MAENESFTQVLQRLIAKDVLHRELTYGQIAKASGLPRRTVARWLSGERDIRRPHRWQDLVKLAATLKFSETEVNEVLQAAQHPAIAELRDTINNEKDRELLRPWPPPNSPFLVDKEDLDYFTGREEALDSFETVLTEGTTFYRICGMPGAGKTALAVHIAYKYRERFPDGVIFINVHEASGPKSILNMLARAYNHDVSKLQDLNTLRTEVRKILARKQALVVFDDVHDDREFEPIKPPTDARGTVIVTTRNYELWTTRTAYLLSLNEFATDEAMALFAKILGEARVYQIPEHDAFLRLAEYLGYLPLAIDIAAQHLTYETSLSAAAFLEELQAVEKNLPTLGNIFGDLLAWGNQSVLALFDETYNKLPSGLKQFFTLLGAFKGSDFDVKAAAYVSKTSDQEAKTYLTTLHRRSLIREIKLGRYQLHALLRLYTESKLDQTNSAKRMVEYYVSYAQANRRNISALSLEVPNIRAALRAATERDLQALLVNGVLALYPVLESNGLYDEALTWLEQAQTTAMLLNDVAGQAAILSNTGRLEALKGNRSEAQFLLEQALPLAHESKEPAIICAVYEHLGRVVASQELAAAETYLRSGLDIARDMNYSEGICDLLGNLAAVTIYQGKIDEAKALLREGLALSEQIGYQVRLISILTNLASIEDSSSNWLKAKGYLESALELARVSRHQAYMIETLINLSAVAINLRDYVQASMYLHEALPRAREIGNANFIIRALRNYGEFYGHLGNKPQSDRYFQEALVMARETDATLLLYTILSDWGEFKLQRREWDAATSLFEEILHSAAAAPPPESIACAKFGMARIKANHREMATACQLARESQYIYEDIEHGRELEVSQWLAEFCDIE